MSNLAVKDGSGTTKYIKSSGAGTDDDPQINWFEWQTPAISVATACSGQITVSSAGTAVQGPDNANTNGFYLKAHPDNTDTVWIGNDGANDVTSSNGYPLNPGEQLIVAVANLSSLWFDADVSASKICWHRA